MHSYFSAVAKAYPQTIGPAWKNVVQGGKPLEDVRMELLQKRFEYWYRKASSMGATWTEAKKDFVDLRVAVQKPGDLTYKQLANAGVWGVHVIGAFCIGEMFGRGRVGGYPVGALANSHH